MKSKHKISKLCLLGGVFLEYFWMSRLAREYEAEVFRLRKDTEQKNYQINRYKDKWDIMIRWKQLDQNGISVSQLLLTKGYQHVAVHGLGEVGEALIKDFLDSGINVRYIIDRDKAGIRYNDIPVVSLEGEIAETDCVVTTTVRNYEEIQEQIEKKGSFKLISLYDLIKETEARFLWAENPVR